jgi:hypothetical protein
MVEPILTTGAAVVGASAWFLNKIGGPSAEALGQALKSYLTGRLRKIFITSEELAKGQPELLTAIPPGFLYQFCQYASFSEDVEEITLMWAHLLITASTNFESKLLTYLDILSKLGQNEAKLLDSIAPKDEDVPNRPLFPLDLAMRYELKKCRSAEDAYERLYYLLTEKKLMWAGGWPVSLTFVGKSYGGGGLQSVIRGESDILSIDVLVRQGVLQRIEQVIEGFSLVACTPTVLGMNFLRVCRGDLVLKASSA